MLNNKFTGLVQLALFAFLIVWQTIHGIDTMHLLLTLGLGASGLNGMNSAQNGK